MNEENNKSNETEDKKSKEAQGTPKLPIDELYENMRSIKDELESNTTTQPNSEDSNTSKQQEDRSARYKKYTSKPSSEEAEKLQIARRMITAAIVMAIVSLFVGGVILSAIGIVFGIIGLLRLNEAINFVENNPFYTKGLKRTAILAIVASVFAFILNFVSMVAIMPQVLEAVYSSDYSNLFSGTGLSDLYGTGNSGSNSTWG